MRASAGLREQNGRNVPECESWTLTEVSVLQSDVG